MKNLIRKIEFGYEGDDIVHNRITGRAFGAARGNEAYIFKVYGDGRIVRFANERYQCVTDGQTFYTEYEIEPRILKDIKSHPDFNIVSRIASTQDISASVLVLEVLAKARIQFLEEDIASMKRQIEEKRTEIKNILEKYRPKN